VPIPSERESAPGDVPMSIPEMVRVAFAQGLLFSDEPRASFGADSQLNDGGGTIRANPRVEALIAGRQARAGFSAGEAGADGGAYGLV